MAGCIDEIGVKVIVLIVLNRNEKGWQNGF